MATQQYPRYRKLSQKLTGEIRERMADLILDGDSESEEFWDEVKQLLKVAIMSGLDIRKEISSIFALAKVEGRKGLSSVKPSQPESLLKLLDKKGA